MGWTKVHTPENLAKAISVEANELLKLFLWEQAAVGTTDEKHWEKELRGELADVLALCLSLSDILHIDLHEAIVEKMDIHRIKYSKDGRNL